MSSFESRHYLLSATLQKDKIPDTDQFLLQLSLLRNLHEIEFSPSITFFVGENGSGKSTLLEALAIGMGLNAEGGSKNFHFATRASHSQLHQALVLNKGIHRPQDSYFLRAESFYNVATEIEDLDREPGMGSPLTPSYGGQSLHTLSHGESFMALIENRLLGQGLYFFDEPEAALSPERQLQLLVRLQELVALNSQFVIATHSPILLAYPDSLIYEIHDSKLVATPYEQTQHYQVMRGFLDNYKSVLKELLS